MLAIVMLTKAEQGLSKSGKGIGNRAAAFGSGPLFPYRKAEKARDFR